MKRLACIAIATAALINAAFASADERTVARLVAISGNVLVSNESNIASAGESLRLAPGMRVLVTLNSAATVEFNDGCSVKVHAGERFEVRGDRPCTARAMSAGVAYAPVLKVRP